MNSDARLTRPRNYYIAGAVLILLGVVIGLGVSAGLGPQRSDVVRPASVSAQPAAATADLESPFVSVVERALPAVVFVDVRRKVGGSGDSDDLFRRFFGDERRPRVTPGSGSGFIIDAAKGFVLTNNHVVRDADDITVTLNDGREFKAKVVGTDPETDVAVIRIDGSNLPSLPLGDSDQLRVGDWAIAIGNPLGQLRGSVTVGIISAQGRSDLNIYGGTPAYQDFIQTDASINFGNSGGPLCNIHGEAIGINTAINPGGQGIGFAIPINLARHVADQLIAGGKVQRAMLGVYLAELTPELAEGFGIAGEHGVVIQNVMDDSPAEHAGLKRNDVIVEFDGKPVTDMQKFRLRVADTAVGKRAPIVVLRDGKKVNLSVTLTDRQTQVLAEGPGVEEATPQAAGLAVREITDEEKRASRASSGVVVTDVDPDSQAAMNGIQPGDIIEEVGGKPVDSANRFNSMVDQARRAKKPAVLLVNTNGQTRFVALRLDQ